MRVFVFASVALMTTSSILAMACGGAPSAPSNTPGQGVGNPSAAAAEPPPASTTTTLTLADGGDLQGAKLETKTTTVVPAGGDAKPSSGGAHKSEPGRGAEDIRTIVMARRDEFRACYDKALKDHPGIEGDLDVRWVIDPKGAVGEIAVDETKSTIHEPSVGKCIIEIVKKIRFAESAKGLETRTHYPFNFNPRSSGRVAPPDAGK